MLEPLERDVGLLAAQCATMSPELLRDPQSRATSHVSRLAGRRRLLRIVLPPPPARRRGAPAGSGRSTRRGSRASGCPAARSPGRCCGSPSTRSASTARGSTRSTGCVRFISIRRRRSSPSRRGARSGRGRRGSRQAGRRRGCRPALTSSAMHACVAWSRRHVGRTAVWNVAYFAGTPAPELLLAADWASAVARVRSADGSWGFEEGRRSRPRSTSTSRRGSSPAALMGSSRSTAASCSSTGSRASRADPPISRAITAPVDVSRSTEQPSPGAV